MLNSMEIIGLNAGACNTEIAKQQIAAARGICDFHGEEIFVQALDEVEDLLRQTPGWFARCEIMACWYQESGYFH
ncbi:hypothetical protein ACFLZ1_04280 [Patescibacteria group bacterium]